MRRANDVAELIGATPVVRLNRVTRNGGKVWLKLESYNPGGSVKDRIALGMIKAAEQDGRLVEGSTIVEPTSGNTGIGLAVIAAARGYRLVLVMPDSMSMERRSLLKAYGAELVLTPGEKGMAGALNRAREILEENPDYFMPQQFANPANPESHFRTTAEEILSQMERRIDCFVAGVGTGGTITGVGRLLRQHLPGVRLVGVEPARSAVLSGQPPARHAIQGIGAGFVPEVLDRSLLDRIVTVEDEDARNMARRLARKEGLLVGVSAGAAAFAAVMVASEMRDSQHVLAIAADSGERYLSTGLFDEQEALA